MSFLLVHTHVYAHVYTYDFAHVITHVYTAQAIWARIVRLSAPTDSSDVAQHRQ